MGKSMRETNSSFGENKRLIWNCFLLLCPSPCLTLGDITCLRYVGASCLEETHLGMLALGLRKAVLQTSVRLPFDGG